MRTLKEILSREDERQNLKHLGFCVLIVCTLVLGAFGMVYVKSLFAPPTGTDEWATVEPPGVHRDEDPK